jgi:hypothetical protein
VAPRTLWLAVLGVGLVLVIVVIWRHLKPQLLLYVHLLRLQQVSEYEAAAAPVPRARPLI